MTIREGSPWALPVKAIMRVVVMGARLLGYRVEPVRIGVVGRPPWHCSLCDAHLKDHRQMMAHVRAEHADADQVMVTPCQAIETFRKVVQARLDSLAEEKARRASAPFN